MRDTHRRGAVADRHRVYAALCAGPLLVFMAVPPAVAQPGAELEIGGGYHAALDLLDADSFTVPSTPTIDARVTAWGSDRWGVAARGLVGLGGVLRGHAGVERRRPTYFQVLVRYRSVGPGGTGLHVGIGGGVLGWTTEDGSQEYVPYLLGLEALASKSLTERLSIRFGASLVLPLHVHPTVLLAWGL